MVKDTAAGGICEKKPIRSGGVGADPAGEKGFASPGR